MPMLKIKQKSKMERVSFWVEKKPLSDLKKLAKKLKTSQAEIIRQTISKILEENK
jgi:hypothetical protein